MKLMKKITKLLLVFSLICCVSSQPDRANCSIANDGVQKENSYFLTSDEGFPEIIVN